MAFSGSAGCQRCLLRTGKGESLGSGAQSTTHIQVVGHGLVSHLAGIKAILAQRIMVLLQEVIQKATFLQGLPQRLPLVQGDPAEMGRKLA